MKLDNFRIRNFRSVNDSGDIVVSQRAALVGRNESGKTNLLLALQSLNPPSGVRPLDPVKDFPRDRLLSEQNDSTAVVWTSWSLSNVEAEELETIFPRAAGTASIIVERNFGGERDVNFLDLGPVEVDDEVVRNALSSLRPSLQKSSSKLQDPQKKTALLKAVEEFAKRVEAIDYSNPHMWAKEAAKSCKMFRQMLRPHPGLLTDNAETWLSEIEREVTRTHEDSQSRINAEAWILERMPTFIYLQEYPELSGHQDMAAFVNRENTNRKTTADKNFDKLMKVAGLDPKELHQLQSAEHEKRQQLANRAGAVVTRKLRELWTDRSLKIRFNLDACHFDTLVSDPNNLYDVEVNLDERSRGFKWFFSFYITFAADTASGDAENAILLLDEPGLYLHAIAQRDLLNHFKSDFSNQIVYTTHSPFMIPANDLRAVKTVNISTDKGTTVTNDPSGDPKTLFPLQSALGYDLAQHLFVGKCNLVVEGVSDYWYIDTVSSYLNAQYGTGLDDSIIITPSGGAQRVPYMVALLSSQNLNVVVLLDDENKSRRVAREELAKAKLIRDENILFATDAFEDEREWADIEDLLAPQRFAELVEESCQRYLEGQSLDPNHKNPRIVKAYEAAFRKLGVDFHHTTPARLFLHRFPEKPEHFLADGTRERFERLFRCIEKQFDKLADRVRPFG